MRQAHAIVLSSLLFVGCNLPGEAADAPDASVVSAVPAAISDSVRALGWELPALAVIEQPSAMAAPTLYRLALGGITIADVGGAIDDAGIARFSSIRLELTESPRTAPLVGQADAAQRATTATEQVGRVTGAELVLVPQIVHRLRGAAPSGRHATATDYERVVHRFDLRWRVETEVDGEAWLVEVDAITGSVTRSRPLAPRAFGTIYAKSQHSGTRKMYGYNTGGEFPVWQLKDLHGNDVELYGHPNSIYSNEDTNSFGDGLPYTANDEVSVNGETAAADAFIAEDVIWKLFVNVLSLDGPLKGQPFTVNVHWREANSQWRQEARAVDIGYVSLMAIPQQPLATIDIIGHEVGHGYLRTWTSLTDAVIDGVLAGIDEATGDILGTAAENYRYVAWGEHPGVPIYTIPQDGNFVMGDETGHHYRSLYAPPIPAWYPGLDYETHDEHALAGPIDRMFYILCMGLDPVPSTGYTGDPRTSPYLPAGMAPIGLTRATQLWAAAVPGLVMNASWTDARNLALAAAGNEYPVKRAAASAFAAVNIGLPAPTDQPVVTATAAQDLQDVVVTSSIGTGPDWLGSTDVSVDNVLYARRDQQSFVVSVPAKLLSTGTHTVVVQATDSWGNVGTKKLGVIIDRTGPTLAAAVAGPPKTPTVTATTSDPAGISRVEFVRDGVLVATDLTAPYTTTFDTSTWTDGAHSIDVVSVDGFANSTTRTLVITADNTPPVVSLTASGTSPFLLTATAVDASPLAQTVFLVDGATYATDTSAPFAASWGPSDAATHVLTARLRDSFGNEGTATIIAPRDTWAPTTTLSATQSGYAVMLSVLAIDPCGITLPMEVRVDGILVAQPNLQTWSGVLPTGLFSAGQHTLSLVAADRCGNTAQSSQTFSILLNTPIVSIVKDAGVDKKHPIVRATVTHDRPIARVEFWRVGPSGTTVVATDTTAPYSTVLDTSSWPDGTLGVAAVAIDSIGMPGRADTDVLVDNTPPAVAVTWTHNGGHAVQFDLTVGNGLGGSPLVDVWMAVFGLIPTTHFQHPPYRLIATPLGSTTDLVGGGCATDDYGNQGCTSVALRLACQTSGRGLETCTVTLLPW